jgi:hypothetical protein
VRLGCGGAAVIGPRGGSRASRVPRDHIDVDSSWRWATECNRVPTKLIVF